MLLYVKYTDRAEQNILHECYINVFHSNRFLYRVAGL